MSDIAKRNAPTVALITGGAQGVGFAIARQLIAEGARRVALAGRDTTKGEAACAELAALGAEARFFRTDVTDPSACLTLMEDAVSAFGEINALVNAAASAERSSPISSGSMTMADCITIEDV